MPDALEPLGWGIVVASALTGLGYFWDERVTPEIRDNVYKTLKKILSKDVATLFVAAFDRVFDPHAQGPAALLAYLSCASCVAITAVALVLDVSFVPGHNGSCCLCRRTQTAYVLVWCDCLSLLKHVVGRGGASSMPPQQRNSIEMSAPCEWKP